MASHYTRGYTVHLNSFFIHFRLCYDFFLIVFFIHFNAENAQAQGQWKWDKKQEKLNFVYLPTSQTSNKKTMLIAKKKKIILPHQNFSNSEANSCPSTRHKSYLISLEHKSDKKYN